MDPTESAAHAPCEIPWHWLRGSPHRAGWWSAAEAL